VIANGEVDRSFPSPPLAASLANHRRSSESAITMLYAGAVITAVVSIVTFALGLLLGHRLALGRDRRREFNEAARPVRQWLLKQANHLRWYVDEPSLIEMDFFTSCLSSQQRELFVADLREYHAIGGGSTAFGEWIHADPAAAERKIATLLSYSDRR